MDDKLVFNNKKFLSSKNAGEFSNYTNDYVARLCRQGKVEGRIVGRTWYVEEQSFLKFLSEHRSQKEQRKKQLSKERIKEYSFSLKEQQHSFVSNILHSVLRGNVVRHASVFAIVLSLIFGTYVIYDFGSYTESPRMADEQTIKNIFAREGLKVASAVVIQRVGNVASIGSASVIESVASFFEYVWRIASGAFRSLAVNDTETDVTSPVIDQEFTVDERLLAQSDKERGGMVVVPSSGSDEDEARKKEIEDSFSDEIKIIPAADGRSGIIKPVFKTPDEQEYLYVLVPVEERVAEK